MDLRRKPNGKWELRWREGARKRGRTFDRKGDAQKYMAWLIRRRQLGLAAVPEDVPLCELVETYWRLHAVPNLADSTRDFYKRDWANHKPRLGDYGVRELTPSRLARFREELEHADIGAATVVKCMRIVQSILSFAISEELVEYNAMASVRKPRYQRAREPYIFLPAEVEKVRANLEKLRDRTLVSVLAYSGPRPEEVVCRLAWDDIGERAMRYRDQKRHRVRFTPLLAPLAEDLREWFLVSGRPDRKAPVFPAYDGDFWDRYDWANWRRTVWKGEPARPANDRRKAKPARSGAAPAGTRPRDLRSSYVTLRVYEGVPLTTIAKEVGTSVLMIEQHYAGVIENWDGERVPAERQIRAARSASGRGMDVMAENPGRD
jgi:integrase